MNATTLRKEFSRDLVVCRLLANGRITQQNFYPNKIGRACLGDERQAGWYTNHDLTVARHLSEGWQVVGEFSNSPTANTPKI